ncbi:MAG: hypothetical protein V1718_03170 [archaeon]
MEIIGITDDLYITPVGGFYSETDIEHLDGLAFEKYLTDPFTGEKKYAVMVAAMDVVGINKHILDSFNAGIKEDNRYILEHGIRKTPQKTLDPGAIVYVRDNRPFFFRKPLELVEICPDAAHYDQSFSGAILPYNYSDLYKVDGDITINATLPHLLERSAASLPPPFSDIGINTHIHKPDI